MDATAPYLDFWPRIQKSLASADIETAWFHCTYTLTPHAAYPTQFEEAVEALRYIVEDLGRSPSQILLAGDSAGANLCLAVLSHLTHPSDGVPDVEASEHRDIDAREVMTEWSRAYPNGWPSNNYIEAAEASEGWWNNTQVQQILVLAGGDEALLDPIKAWVNRFKVSGYRI
ncbi:putative epsilon-lactone hydrolase [Aspergillus udagawae]|uniref:Alpha/beta hydrolase fold-3 domain-containing protein n=1 Tax=Aspergillus udagawae TaxID=91492 RepID=A0A8E0V393_9EURO|nr:uncharacterized protein Aud_008817 [Aspergillus udagawae]GIC92351.1 hypothetical protein Aud_008817 [Aspergillus udagawae]